MKKFLVLSALISSMSYGSVLVKEIISFNKSLSFKEVSWSAAEVNRPVVLRDLPLYMGEQDFTSQEVYRETLYPNLSSQLLDSGLPAEKENIDGSEVRTILKQGPDANRIVLTILGDGYTEAEKVKFFDDVQRIVSDLFVQAAFKSYQPLFNIYAVFVPSQESGITDLTTKKTAFGLYRSPKGSKRGIMPGNTTAIEKALKLAPADATYPIIIANDQFYGGLGGRYAITSASKVAGPVVLRHELGHNFSNVGEEYDGGQVYSGANFSTSPDGSWDQWRTGSGSYDSQQLFGAYVWQPLSQPFVQKFKSDDTGAFFNVQISSVGWENEGDVEVLLDGAPLELKGVYTYDRSFFDSIPFHLNGGDHELVIRSNGNQAKHVMAFANGYSYPANYDFTPGEIKAFSVYSEGPTKEGYRPTENSCPMRDMNATTFCSVDQENIWLQFLMRLNLIDSLSVVNGQIELVTVPLPASNIEITWFQAGKEVPAYKGKKTLPLEAQVGGLKVQVKIVSSEIRKVSPHFQDEKSL